MGREPHAAGIAVYPAEPRTGRWLRNRTGSHVDHAFLPKSSVSLRRTQWADPTLKTTQGLVLRIAATRQPDAWKANGKPPLANGAALAVAYDGSGNGLHLTQNVKDAQPHFVSAASKAVVEVAMGNCSVVATCGPAFTVRDVGTG